MKTLTEKCTLLSLTVWFLTAASISWGQDLVLSFDFTGEPGNQESTTASISASGVSGGIIDRGLGLGRNTTTSSLNTNGWNSLDPAEDYISIRFTVDPGYSLDLASFQLRTDASATGPGHLGLFYNGDNFAQELFTLNQPNTTLDSQIDLGSLTGLAGNVEFRIIALSDTRADGGEGSIGSTGAFKLFNYHNGGNTGGIHFTGTAIPEPSTYAAVVGAIALAAVGCRRCFSKKV